MRSMASTVLMNRNKNCIDEIIWSSIKNLVGKDPIGSDRVRPLGRMS